ncbi:hypothetical protein [Brevibacillus dissolubilis]|uniref:hypothetical protein n=1 Tax=Brevibacillus dissolubilis TaxID=1844116 RepID=UPI0011174EF5|nr:hypothetical protein [Brevibacillus dissolubilis]
MKKAVSGLLALSMVFGASSAFAAETVTDEANVAVDSVVEADYANVTEVESNDVFRYADYIKSPEITMNGVLTAGSTDRDWFFFISPITGQIRSAAGFGANSGQINIYEQTSYSSLTGIGSSSGTSVESVTFNVVQGKAYYIKLSTSLATDVPYTLYWDAVIY